MERKTLEDYRSEGRLPAADVCACGGRYEIMLLDLDLEQQTGMARIWGQHREGCEALDDASADVEHGVSHEEEDQLAGWGWRQESLDLLGVTYPLYAWCLDVVPCLACWKLIVGVPLLLFGSTGVLAFCQTCFEARRLGQFLQMGDTGKEQRGMGERDRQAMIEAKVREVGALHETFAASLRGAYEAMKSLETEVSVLGNVFALIQRRHGEICDLIKGPGEEDADGTGGGGC